MKGMKGVCYSLYMMTRSKRYLAGSVLKLMNSQVTVRLIHELQNNDKLKDAVKRKQAVLDTLDSWLLFKLRKVSSEHVTDITSATATGESNNFFFVYFKQTANKISDHFAVFRLVKLEQEVILVNLRNKRISSPV